MKKALFSNEVIERKDEKLLKIKEVLVLLFTLVIGPIVSILVCTSTGERPIYTSLSRIAWPGGKLALAYFVATIALLCFFAAVKLALYGNGFSILTNRIFTILTILVALFIIVGLSIPAYYEVNDELNKLRTIHCIICAIGIGLMILTMFTLMILCGLRNKEQLIISIFMICASIIAGVFAFLECNDKDSYCQTSAVTEIFLFALMPTLGIIEYYIGKFTKNNRIKEIESIDSSEEEKE